MAYGKSQAITVTTDGSGDATAYIEGLEGYLDAIVYTKTDFATGVDFAITLEASGRGVWTEANVDASKTVRPRAAVHSTAGVALTYDSTEPVADRILLGGERIKVVISNGGATKTGTFRAIAGG